MKIKLIRLYYEKAGDGCYGEYTETIKSIAAPISDWIEVSEEDVNLLRQNLYLLPRSNRNTEYVILEEQNQEMVYSSIEIIKKEIEKQQKELEKRRKEREKITLERKKKREEKAKLKNLQQLEELAKTLGKKVI